MAAAGERWQFGSGQVSKVCFILSSSLTILNKKLSISAGTVHLQQQIRTESCRFWCGFAAADFRAGYANVNRKQ